MQQIKMAFVTSSGLFSGKPKVRQPDSIPATIAVSTPYNQHSHPPTSISECMGEGKVMGKNEDVLVIQGQTALTLTPSRCSCTLVPRKMPRTPCLLAVYMPRPVDSLKPAILLTNTRSPPLPFPPFPLRK